MIKPIKSATTRFHTYGKIVGADSGSTDLFEKNPLCSFWNYLPQDSIIRIETIRLIARFSEAACLLLSY